MSVGAASAEGGDDAPDATELLRRAQLAAAYGRGMESDGLSRLALESDLRGVLGRGEIVPFNQPVVRSTLARFRASRPWPVSNARAVAYCRPMSSCLWSRKWG